MKNGYPSRLIMAVVAAIMLVLPLLQTISVALAAPPAAERSTMLEALLEGGSVVEQPASLTALNAGPLATGADLARVLAGPPATCIGTVGIDQVCINKTVTSPVSGILGPGSPVSFHVQVFATGITNQNIAVRDWLNNNLTSNMQVVGAICSNPLNPQPVPSAAAIAAGVNPPGSFSAHDCTVTTDVSGTANFDVNVLLSASAPLGAIAAANVACTSNILQIAPTPAQPPYTNPFDVCNSVGITVAANTATPSLTPGASPTPTIAPVKTITSINGLPPDGVNTVHPGEVVSFTVSVRALIGPSGTTTVYVRDFLGSNFTGANSGGGVLCNIVPGFAGTFPAGSDPAATVLDCPTVNVSGTAGTIGTTTFTINATVKNAGTVAGIVPQGRNYACAGTGPTDPGIQFAADCVFVQTNLVLPTPTPLGTSTPTNTNTPVNTNTPTSTATAGVTKVISAVNGGVPNPTSVPNALPGQTIQFTITLTNNTQGVNLRDFLGNDFVYNPGSSSSFCGVNPDLLVPSPPGSATGTIIDCAVPAGTTQVVIAATVAQNVGTGGAVPASQNIGCLLNSLAGPPFEFPNATRCATAQANAVASTATATATVTNTATNTPVNTSTATSTSTPAATKIVNAVAGTPNTVNPAPANIGQSVEFLITISNPPPGPGTFVVRDFLGSNFINPNVVPQAGVSCSTQGGAVTPLIPPNDAGVSPTVLDCTLNGGTTSFTIVAQVAPGATGGPVASSRNVACVLVPAQPVIPGTYFETASGCVVAQVVVGATPTPTLTNTPVPATATPTPTSTAAVTKVVQLVNGTPVPVGPPPAVRSGDVVTFAIHIVNPPAGTFTVRDFVGGNYTVTNSQGVQSCNVVAPPFPFGGVIPGIFGPGQLGTVLDCQLAGGTTDFSLTATVDVDASPGDGANGSAFNVACLDPLTATRCSSAEAITSASPTPTLTSTATNTPTNTPVNTSTITLTPTSTAGITKVPLLVNGTPVVANPPAVRAGDLVTFRISITNPPAGTFVVRDFVGANYTVIGSPGTDCDVIAPPFPVPGGLIPAIFGAGQLGTVLDCQLPGGTTSFTISALVDGDATPGNGLNGSAFNVACLDPATLLRCSQAEAITSASPTPTVTNTATNTPVNTSTATATSTPAVTKVVNAVNGTPNALNPAPAGVGQTVEFTITISNPPTTGSFVVRDFLGSNFINPNLVPQSGVSCATQGGAVTPPNNPGGAGASPTQLDCTLAPGTTSFTIVAQVAGTATGGAVPESRNVACILVPGTPVLPGFYFGTGVEGGACVVAQVVVGATPTPTLTSTAVPSTTATITLTPTSTAGITKVPLLVNGTPVVANPPHVRSGDLVTFRISITNPPAGTFVVRDFVGANYTVLGSQGTDCDVIAPPFPVPGGIIPAIFGAGQLGTVLDCQLPGGTTSFIITALVDGDAVPGNGVNGAAFNVACLDPATLLRCSQAEGIADPTATPTVTRTATATATPTTLALSKTITQIIRGGVEVQPVPCPTNTPGFVVGVPCFNVNQGDEVTFGITISGGTPGGSITILDFLGSKFGRPLPDTLCTSVPRIPNPPPGQPAFFSGLADPNATITACTIPLDNAGGASLFLTAVDLNPQRLSGIVVQGNNVACAATVAGNNLITGPVTGPVTCAEVKTNNTPSTVTATPTGTTTPLATSTPTSTPAVTKVPLLVNGTAVPPNTVPNVRSGDFVTFRINIVNPSPNTFLVRDFVGANYTVTNSQGANCDTIAPPFPFLQPIPGIFGGNSLGTVLDCFVAGGTTSFTITGVVDGDAIPGNGTNSSAFNVACLEPLALLTNCSQAEAVTSASPTPTVTATVGRSHIFTSKIVGGVVLPPDSPTTELNLVPGNIVSTQVQLSGVPSGPITIRYFYSANFNVDSPDNCTRVATGTVPVPVGVNSATARVLDCTLASNGNVTFNLSGFTVNSTFQSPLDDPNAFVACYPPTSTAALDCQPLRAQITQATATPTTTATATPTTLAISKTITQIQRGGADIAPVACPTNTPGFVVGVPCFNVNQGDVVTFGITISGGTPGSQLQVLDFLGSKFDPPFPDTLCTSVPRVPNPPPGQPVFTTGLADPNAWILSCSVTLSNAGTAFISLTAVDSNLQRISGIDPAGRGNNVACVATVAGNNLVTGPVTGPVTCAEVKTNNTPNTLTPTATATATSTPTLGAVITKVVQSVDNAFIAQLNSTPGVVASPNSVTGLQPGPHPVSFVVQLSGLGPFANETILVRDFLNANFVNVRGEGCTLFNANGLSADSLPPGVFTNGQVLDCVVPVSGTGSATFQITAELRATSPVAPNPPIVDPNANVACLLGSAAIGESVPVAPLLAANLCRSTQIGQVAQTATPTATATRTATPTAVLDKDVTSTGQPGLPVTDPHDVQGILPGTRVNFQIVAHNLAPNAQVTIRDFLTPNVTLDPGSGCTVVANANVAKPAGVNPNAQVLDCTFTTDAGGNLNVGVSGIVVANPVPPLDDPNANVSCFVDGVGNPIGCQRVRLGIVSPTPTPTPTFTPTPTNTPSPTPTPCGGVGTQCQAKLTPVLPPQPVFDGHGLCCSPGSSSNSSSSSWSPIGSGPFSPLGPLSLNPALLGPLFKIAQGPITQGCDNPLPDNDLCFTNTGSFTVQGTITNLLPGDVPTVRIPVVNATGDNFREVTCNAADFGGRSTCNATVNDAGVWPQLGGIVEVRVHRLPPPPPPILAPPPIELLPPPPPPLLPPPPMAPARAVAKAFPEVPVIPEADTMLLVVGGLAALGALVGFRSLRGRRDDD